MRIGISFSFAKSDPSGRFVRGWASVVADGGNPVVDSQGDVISVDDLRRAAHKFVTDARVAKAMHSGQPVGEVVESVIVDDELAAALGIADGKRGWWIGMEIHDPAVQQDVRKGRLKAFSIGGSGRRTKVEA